ncbi:DUF1102 domain-containing protein [Halolamina sediminis]|uniref:DUF1102 domain-containing protein n=1 Tax=Halolamina sediminis TaxID=1480675 RepID=UPI0012AB5ADA|nr:DUF1102 domain-containing protein [Halolamina sediminis]
MDRRKFIAGLGSLTAAGAAGIGTGAFTGVRASRDVSLEVSGDGNAYLGLQPTSEYASFDGDGALTLDFTSDGDGDGGLNPDANTNFNDLFTITNNGSETVAVWFNTGKPNAPGAGSSEPTFHDELADLLNVSPSGLNPGGGRGANYGFYRSDLDSADENFDDVTWSPSNQGTVNGSWEVALPPGTTVSVGFWLTVPPGSDYNADMSGSIKIFAYTEDQAESS